MLNYEATQRRKEIIQEMAKQIKVKPGSSFTDIINLVRYGTSMVRRAKADTKRKIDENNDTLSQRLADEANTGLTNNLNQYIADIKAVLTNQVHDKFEQRKNAVQDFVKELPSDTTGQKMLITKNYGYAFDKHMWNAYFSDQDILSNYPAMLVVEQEARNHGIDVFLKPNIDRILEQISDLEEMADTAISHIDVEHDIVLASFIAEDQNSPVSERINELDSEIATIIRAPQKTIIKRLKDAEKHAYDVSDFRTSARIKVFLDNHGNVLASPEDIKDGLLEEAEELVIQGMNAKKGDN